MTRHETLNNVSHKDLKVNTARRADLGDNVMSSKIYPMEFREVQAHYPIFFFRDQHSVMPVALFGFEQNDNLFLNEQGWDAGYLPLLIERHPFTIGRSQTQDQSESLVINVDLDSPRVNTVEGESVFLPSGGNSDYIERIASVLHAIHEGETLLPAFMDALENQQLLEPFFLDIDLGAGQSHRLSGFLTINEEKLAALDASVAADFHSKGWLAALHMVLASHSQVRELIRRKQARL